MKSTRLIHTFALLLLFSLFFSACNLPQSPNTKTVQPSAQASVEPTALSTQQRIATEVQKMLTALPSATPAPTNTLPAASATPQPTSTVSLTFTPTVRPSQTAVSTDPKQTLGQPSWKDTLTASKNFFAYKDENVEIKPDKESLLLTGIKANGWMGWSLTHNAKPQNFYLEGIFRTRACNGGDQYGLVMRAPSDQEGYFYTATCDGRIALRRWDGKESSDILALTPAKGFNAGSNQVNRLGVMAIGNKFTFYINGIPQKEVSDSNYPNAGYLGVFVAGVKTAGFTVELDEIAFWNRP